MRLVNDSQKQEHNLNAILELKRKLISLRLTKFACKDGGAM